MARPAPGFSLSAASTSASEALISEDGHYRWWLRRRWDQGEGLLLFIGLNPSRADGNRDDPTLRRLIGFARGWGYRELLVLNLFARISPSPAALRRVQDPVGARNDAVLEQWCSRWAQLPDWDLWCGWGVGGSWRHRDQAVRSRLLPLMAERQRCLAAASGPLTIALTRGGHPRHPLYAPSQSALKPFAWAEAQIIRHPETTSAVRRPR